jgi:hypothetical protein
MFIKPSISKSAHFDRLSFPTRKDYGDYFLKQKVVAKESEIWSSKEYVGIIHRHWHGEGRNGCIFALLAARRAKELGWLDFVVTEDIETIENSSVLSKVEKQIKESISNPDCEILSLLFSNIVTTQDFVRLIRLLLTLEMILLSDEQVTGKLVSVSLRIPLGHDVLSWVMAFGPYKHFPETRQSPITEITIRVNPKPERQFHRLSKDKDAAHLADLPLDYHEGVMEQTWQNTLRRTRQIIGGEPDNFSAAKTTFSVPKKEWNKVK